MNGSLDPSDSSLTVEVVYADRKGRTVLNVVRGIVFTLLVFAIVLFIGDWAWYKLSGSPHASVTISHFVSAPLKNNKQELDYLGSEDVPCAISLLPQGGMAPCWYLRRHTNQVSTY